MGRFIEPTPQGGQTGHHGDDVCGGSCVGPRYYSYSKKPTEREFFVPVRELFVAVQTQILVKLSPPPFPPPTILLRLIKSRGKPPKNKIGGRPPGISQHECFPSCLVTEQEASVEDSFGEDSSSVSFLRKSSRSETCVGEKPPTKLPPHPSFLVWMMSE